MNHPTMSPTGQQLLALAERCEAAEESEQRRLLEEAFSLVHPGLQFPAPRPYSPPQLARFAHMLDANAFESAAMLLIPPGVAEWHCGKHYKAGKGRARMVLHSAAQNPIYTLVRSTCPALALVAASLKARAAMEMQDA